MLSGYRVLDLCDDRGFIAGFMLAQMGAEVVMVEPQEGLRHRHRGPYVEGIEHPDRSLSHLTQDRGKSSVIISNDTELIELAMTADVLLECGAFEVDLELLRSQNPGLITVSISFDSKTKYFLRYYQHVVEIGFSCFNSLLVIKQLYLFLMADEHLILVSF